MANGHRADNRCQCHGPGVVLGAQWGDEGKGKLVDILAQACPCIEKPCRRKSLRWFTAVVVIIIIIIDIAISIAIPIPLPLPLQLTLHVPPTCAPEGCTGLCSVQWRCKCRAHAACWHLDGFSCGAYSGRNSKQVLFRRDETYLELRQSLLNRVLEAKFPLEFDNLKDLYSFWGMVAGLM
jgi:hypothetical protein